MAEAVSKVREEAEAEKETVKSYYKNRLEQMTKMLELSGEGHTSELSHHAMRHEAEVEELQRTTGEEIAALKQQLELQRTQLDQAQHKAQESQRQLASEREEANQALEAAEEVTELLRRKFEIAQQAARFRRHRFETLKAEVAQTNSGSPSRTPKIPEKKALSCDLVGQDKPSLLAQAIAARTKAERALDIERKASDLAVQSANSELRTLKEAIPQKVERARKEEREMFESEKIKLVKSVDEGKMKISMLRFELEMFIAALLVGFVCVFLAKKSFF